MQNRALRIGARGFFTPNQYAPPLQLSVHTTVSVPATLTSVC
jgi:hypothetical protein